MAVMQLEIVTPEKKIFSEPVSMVSARGTGGELGILPGHIPLVTPLKVGTIRIKQDNAEKIVAVSGGFLEVRPDKVTVLAETAELPSDIDINRATASKERAEARLKEAKDNIDFKRAELSLHRATNRLEVAQRR